MSTANWVLPWHYLGGPICLLYRANVLPELIARLNQKSPQELAEILHPDQPLRSNGNPPLFDEVAKVGMDFPKAPYTWTDPWPASLALRLREMPDATERRPFVLTPTTLILQWPFPDDGGLRDKPRDPVRPIPCAPPPNAATDFYSSNFMRMADSLVTDQRPVLSKPGTNDPLDPADAEQKIKDEVQKKHGDTVGIPDDAHLDVTPLVGTPTTHTRWEGFAGRLHLVLGWDEVPSPPPGAFDAWPCGAFKGF